MICGTCGRDNPARLTFCEDCGARLAARVAAPTPPVGIPRVDSNAPGHRPSAPDFTFTRKEQTPRSPGTASGPPSSSGGGAAAANPQPASPASPSSAPSSSPRPSAPEFLSSPTSPPKIRVQAPVGERPGRTCRRCRGISEAGVAFCRFCGASLDDALDDGAKNTSPGIGGGPAVVPEAAVANVLSVGQDGKPSATFELAKTLDIGRSEGDVVIGWDPYLSARHLRFEVREGVVYARDLGTVNGTYLRLRAKPRAPSRKNPQPAAGEPTGDDPSEAFVLQDQDLILLGQQVIRFEVVKDAEAGFGPATQHGTAVFGTPAGPVYARLCQRTVEGVTRDVFHVRKDEVVLGRELGDVVFTDDAFLSRRHAILRRESSAAIPATFVLADAGSSNGTFVRVRGEVRLQGGDEIRIGQQLFRIELPPAAPRGAS